MVNIKPIIVCAMKGDNALVGLLGGEKIYHKEPPEEITPPLVTYAEIDNEPIEFGDEKELFSRVTMEIVPWTKKNKPTSAIAAAIDRIMVTLGGKRERAADDEVLAMEAKPMVYSFVVEAETLEIL